MGLSAARYRLRHGWWLPILFWVFVPLTAVAGGATQGPQDVVTDTANTLIQRLRQDHDRLTRNAAELRRVVEQILDPASDYPLSARLVLGRYWNQATPAQRERFLRDFRGMLLRTYTAPLLEYAQDIAVEVLPGSPPAKDRRATVRTVLAIGGRPPVPVNYHLRQGEDGWKVYDVVIQGVSAIVTFRSSFAEEIQRFGLSGFLDRLAERSHGPDGPPGSAGG
jgi:phospholipid transport system substrate-binding protein